MKRSTKSLLLFTLFFLSLATVEIYVLQWLSPLEGRLSDLFVRQQAKNLTADPEIVIIDIGDDSLELMKDVGYWPWPRSVHGELVRGIARQRPKAIVFDISFEQADVYRPDSDRAFNESLEGNTNIFFPMVRRPALQDVNGPLATAIADRSKIAGLIPTDHAQANAKIALSEPLAVWPRFWRTGNIKFEEDPDGVGRRYSLFTDAYGWLIPSLPARVASDLGYAVPRQEDMILAWRGGIKPFQRIPYAELYLDLDREKPLRAQNELKGKIVIIGADASSLQDVRHTPIANPYSGVDILATAIDNLKNQRMMRAAPEWFAAMFGFVLLAALCGAFLYRINVLKIGVALLATTILTLGGSYIAVAHLFLLPVLTPILLVWLYYFSCALKEYLREKKSREHAVQMFSRFVNPHVVQELIEHGGLSGTGESRQISVLFSDIRGFTTLCETRSPQEVVSLLNRYFTMQVEVVFRYGGSLDKFIGDCIMAFWGAPLDYPQHALHAVEAALEMADVLQRFKEELGEQDVDFDVGIGIHSGPAVVGLIGSEQRREYTAIGDTVNLASRIEGLTKGISRILVSRETMELCGDKLDFRSVGSYKVKGREQEVELFAPTRRTVT